MYLDCLKNIVSFEETKKILKKNNIIVKNYDDLNLYLVKYDKKKCDMSNQDVKKCRGLILEKNTNKLVCVPPPHYENIEIMNNYSIDELNFEEYIEGTMMNVFKYNGQIFVSTRSCIGGLCNFYSKKTFLNMFSEIIDIEKFNSMDENLSLTFIIQHPENIIVKKFKTANLVLVHAVSLIDNNLEYLDLQEVKNKLQNISIDINIPKKFKYESINDLYHSISRMTKDEQGVIIKNINKNSYIRSKLRNDYHNYVRNIKGSYNNKKYLYLVLKQNGNLLEYLKYFEEDEKLFDIYQLEINDTINKLFNYYQDYYVRKDEANNKKINFKDIDFEYKPLCISLHNDFKQTKNITTKQKVAEFIYKLPIAKLLFVINYKYRFHN